MYCVGEMVRFTSKGIAYFRDRGFPPVMFDNPDGYKVVSANSYYYHVGLYLNQEKEHFLEFTDDGYIEKTGQMADFGKHPFKDFYLNKITPDDLPPHSYKSRVLDFVKKFDHPFLWGHDLEFFWPNVESNENEWIFCWPNAKAREKGKAGRTKMKPGKFFRLLHPTITDKQVEEMVEAFKEQFSPIENKVFSGQRAEDFLHAYTSERGADRNFSTSSAYKRMCDSCMRYGKEYFGTPIHPVETYATGDWTIFWTEDQQGRVTGRCLAKSEYNRYELGPIYATCLEAIDTLEKHFKTLNTSGVYKGDWNGAKILKEGEDGRFVTPYFDLHGNMSEEGKCLVLDHLGNIEHHHEGWTQGCCTCEWCEDRVAETFYVQSVECGVCERCLEDDFFVSDLDNEHYRDSERVEVYYSHYHYYEWTDTQAENEAVFSEEANEWIHPDHVIETYEGKHIPQWYIRSGDWFVCVEDDLAYPSEERVDTPEGPMAKSNIPEDSPYYRCDETEDMVEGKVA